MSQVERTEHFERRDISTGERASSPALGETYLLFSAIPAKPGQKPEAVEVFWTGIAEVHQAPRNFSHDLDYLCAYFCQLLDIDNSNRFERIEITSVRRSLRRNFSEVIKRSPSE